MTLPSPIRRALLALAPLVWLSCADDDPAGPSGTDTVPPAAVELRIVRQSGTTVTLGWDAPGDDGTAGQASAYDLRTYSRPYDDLVWEQATRQSIQAPAAAGTPTTVTFSSLSIGTTYRFRLRTMDDALNWSALSNEVALTPDGSGPNRGGVLLLHLNARVTYTNDPGQGPEGRGGLDSCGDAIVELAEPDGGLHVWYLYLAFPSGSSPRVRALAFALDYDPEAILIDHFGSSDLGAFMVTTEEWPDPGTGAAIAWSEAGTTQLQELFWFAGTILDPSSPAHFEVRPHPESGGMIVDDSIPPVPDSLADYGRLGFGPGATGYRPCPTGR